MILEIKILLVFKRTIKVLQYFMLCILFRKISVFRRNAPIDTKRFIQDRDTPISLWVIDGDKAQKELGWERGLQFEEGIEETVNWYLENQEWVDHVTSGEYQKYYEEMYKNR